MILSLLFSVSELNISWPPRGQVSLGLLMARPVPASCWPGLYQLLDGQAFPASWGVKAVHSPKDTIQTLQGQVYSGQLRAMVVLTS